MKISERKQESNQEVIVNNNKELVSLKEHLAIEKILVSNIRNPHGKEVGFFKLVNGILQLHICIPKENNKKEWHRFLVLDVIEEERERNKRLNILGGESDG